MQALSVQEIATTLVLRSEERENLLYIVEIEEGKNKHLCYSSENYFQALLIAKRIFNKLKTRQSEIGDFGVLIEAQQGRGVSYEINDFSFGADFCNSDSFYQELVNEFETRRFQTGSSNNVLFRTMVREQKLNEYQEQQFLFWLKRMQC